MKNSFAKKLLVIFSILALNVNLLVAFAEDSVDFTTSNGKLQESDNVNATFVDSNYYYYATDEDVVVIKKSDNSVQCFIDDGGWGGYGFNSVVADSTYLYFGPSNGSAGSGIWRIALADCSGGDDDSGSISKYAGSVGGTVTISSDVVTSLSIHDIGGTNFLTYTSGGKSGAINLSDNGVVESGQGGQDFVARGDTGDNLVVARNKSLAVMQDVDGDGKMYLFDDFEDGTDGSWNLNSNATISGGTANGSGTTSANNFDRTVSISGEDEVYFRTRLYYSVPGGTPVKSAGIYFLNGVTQFSSVVANGYYSRTYVNGTNYNGSGYGNSAWHDIEVLLDFANYDTTVWIDGTLVADEEVFDSNQTGMSKIAFRAYYSGSSIKVDDIVVATRPVEIMNNNKFSNFPDATINDVFVTDGTSSDSSNTYFVGTSSGVTQIDSDETAGTFPFDTVNGDISTYNTGSDPALTSNTVYSLHGSSDAADGTGYLAVGTASGLDFVDLSDSTTNYSTSSDPAIVSNTVNTLYFDTTGTIPYGNSGGAGGGAITGLFNTAPTLAITSAAQTTDGTGYVTINYTATDADEDDVSLATYQYSTDSTNGTDGTWSTMTEKGGVSSDGTSGLSADTDGVAHDFMWDVATDVADTEDGVVFIRLKLNDGAADSSTVASSSFAIDTASPTGVTNFTYDEGGLDNITLDWTAGSDGNFSHYEIWWGQTAADINNRTGTATEWDNSDDTNLATASTATTTVTGMERGQTYYFKIWAVDDYGNETAYGSQIEGLTPGGNGEDDDDDDNGANSGGGSSSAGGGTQTEEDIDNEDEVTLEDALEEIVTVIKDTEDEEDDFTNDENEDDNGDEAEVVKKKKLEVLDDSLTKEEVVVDTFLVIDSVFNGNMIPGRNQANWTAMYKNGKPTEVQKIAYSFWDSYVSQLGVEDRTSEKYKVLVKSFSYFIQVFSETLIPSKDNPVWTAMYVDGEPTEAQRVAYRAWESYYKMFR